MTTEKRKPRDKPAPYQRQLKTPKVKDAPATSAHPTARTSSCPNLTLSDWLAVFAYVDAHPAMPQCRKHLHCVGGLKEPASSLE
ncbi:hypothetical protein AZE42_08675, partial [Rhizopogon vesiculosus]